MRQITHIGLFDVFFIHKNGFQIKIISINNYFSNYTFIEFLFIIQCRLVKDL
jgi:hypothetical protein